MNRRSAGVAFCFIAAFLISVRYISAAVLGSGVGVCNADLFGIMINSTGNTLVSLSKISLTVGIVYLVLAELEGTYKGIYKLLQKIAAWFKS